MNKLTAIIGLLLCPFWILSQVSNDTIILDRLPDTLVISTFTDYTDYEFAYIAGQTYDPDTLKLYHDTTLVSSITLPKTSVATISDMVTTILHNGSGYEVNNGFGVTTEFGYYLVQNDDGTIQLNDWNQSLSGEIIDASSFGNQAPVEFQVVVMGQDTFLDPSLNTDTGEVEVYVNGLRLLSTEYTIDTSATGIILNTGLNIGENIIIDID